MAEHEARLISERTKAALQAAKARGVKLGTPGNLRRAAEGRVAGVAAICAKAAAYAQSLAPLLEELAPGRSLRALARELNARHIRPPRGGRWYAASVARVLMRLGLMPLVRWPAATGAAQSNGT